MKLPRYNFRLGLDWIRYALKQRLDYSRINVSSHSEKCKMERAAYINIEPLRFQQALHRTHHIAHRPSIFRSTYV